MTAAIALLGLLVASGGAVEMHQAATSLPKSALREIFRAETVVVVRLSCVQARERAGEKRVRCAGAASGRLEPVYRRIAYGENDRIAAGQLPEYFDRGREHEWRVISIKEAVFGANDENVKRDETMPDPPATKVSRFMDTDDENVGAKEGDLAYDYFLQLMQPKDEGRATPGAGEYAVRFGTDDSGIDCSLKMNPNEVTGTVDMYGECGGDWLPEAIHAEDILYIELYLSGNAENVLYRFNFYGVTPRLDSVTANSAFTVDKVIEPGDTSPIDRNARTPHSKPNDAIFFLTPLEIKKGIAKVCLTEDCSGTGSLLKEVNIETYSQTDSTYTTKEFDPPRGVVKEPLDQLETAGLAGARYFALPLPPDMAAMPGSNNSPKRFWVVIEPTEPTKLIGKREFGYPVGGYDSAAATAAGQMVLAGVNVTDGHLVRQYDDVVVPEKGITRRFTRTYNNQRNELSPMGAGWMHNYEGYLQEELPGRYQVVLEGQAYDFPECTVARGTKHEVTSITLCKSDKNHGGTLTIEKAEGDPNRPAAYKANGFKAIYDDGFGTKYTFDQLSHRRTHRGGRRFLLTKIDDPLSSDITVKYIGETDWVDEATRPSGISFKFEYDELPTTPRPHREVQAWKKNFGLKVLKRVVGKLSDDTEFFAEDFRYDVNAKPGASDPCSPEAAQAEDGVLNPLYVCRKTRIGANGESGEDVRWTLTWTGSGPVRLRNEMASEKLEALQPSTNVAFDATYTRDTDEWYAHLAPEEIVRTADLPGEEYEYDYVSETSRNVKWPTGSEKRNVTLNKYGNVKSVETPCGLSSGTWDSEVDDKAVVPKTSSSPSSYASAYTYDERNRSLKSSLTQVPSTTELQKAEGLNAGTAVEITELDDPTGQPKKANVPKAGKASGTVTLTTTVSSSGLITGQSLPGGPSWNQPLDVNGLPDGPGTDINGNQVTWSGQTADEFGQPSQVDVLCTGCPTSVSTTGGVAVNVARSISYGFEYDGLGRVEKLEDTSGGVTVETTYDGLGRVTAQSVAGGPSESWTFEYELNDQDERVVTGNVTRTVDGSPVTKTVVWKSKRGLLRETTNELGESTKYEYTTGECAPAKISTKGTDDSVKSEVRYIASNVTNLTKEIQVWERSGGELTKKTTMHLDVLGRVIGTTHEDEPDNKVRYELDQYGNVVGHIYGDGHNVRFDLDDVGQLKATFSDPGNSRGGLSTVINTRDTAGRVTKQTRLDPFTTEEYEYDVYGRVAKETKTVRGYKRGTVTGNVLAQNLKSEKVIEYKDNVRPRQRIIRYLVESPDGNHRSQRIDIEVDDKNRTRVMSDSTGTVTHEYKEDHAESVTEICTATTIGTQTIREKQVFEADGTATIYGGCDSSGSVNGTLTFYHSGRLHQRVQMSPRTDEIFTYDGDWVRTRRNFRNQDPDTEELFTRKLDDRGRVLSEEISGGDEQDPVYYSITNAWDNVQGTVTTEIKETSENTSALFLRFRKTGEMDGNNNLVDGDITEFDAAGEVVRAFDLITLYDAAGASIDSGGTNDDPRNYSQSGSTHLEWLRRHEDGSVTIVGHFGTTKRELWVPAEYWHVRPPPDPQQGPPPDDGDCALESSPPDVVDKAILRTLAGEYIGALTLVKDNPASDGRDRCDLQALALYASQLQYDINRREFNAYAQGLVVEGAIEIGLMALPGVGAAVVGAAHWAKRAVTGRALNQSVGGAIRRTACFAAGVPVLTDDGRVPIEELDVGDLVWSRDERTGEEQWRPVMQVFVTPEQPVLELSLVDDDGAADTLLVTGEHPFWVDGEGWLPAEQLLVDDAVYSAHGGWLRVGSSTWAQERETVYNLEVQGTHTYFVGASAAWVHNQCMPGVTRWSTGPSRSLVGRESGGSLYFHDNIGGHVVQSHVGRSHAQLMGRLAREPIPQASTFANLTTADLSVGTALAARRAEVQAWLSSGTGAPLILQESVGFNAGYVLSRAPHFIRPSDRVFVKLVKDRLGPRGYRIQTAFLE